MGCFTYFASMRFGGTGSYLVAGESKRLFIAWARMGRRTIELASEVGARLVLLKDRPPYLKAWRETPRVISAERPATVIAQLPQGPLLARLAGLKDRLGFNLVADVHSGFLVYTSLRESILNGPFKRYLRRCDLVISHNEPFAKLLEEKAGVDPSRVITVYDPFPRLPRELREPRLSLKPGGYLVFPSSWHPDEPLDYVLSEFLSSSAASSYKLVLTGRPRPRGSVKRMLSRAEERVVLTGHLPWEEYYWVLSNARAIIAATTKEYTMLSAAWEAAAVERPLIVGETKTLKSIIGGYAVYFEVGVRGSLSSILDDVESVNVDLEGFRRHLESLSRGSIRRLLERLDELESS